MTTSTTSTTTPAGGSTIFNGDFETGDLSQFDGTYCYTSYACTVVDAPGGHTGKAARFETHQNDPNAFNGGATVRAQIQVNSNERSGDESWWHWELYLPSTWKPSSSGWGDSVFEWHHFSTVGDGLCRCPSSPPWTFGIYQGRLITRIVNDNVEADGIYWTQYDLKAATPGTWTSYDVHAKWSTDPSVAVEDVYIDGALRQHITGHPNEYVGYFNYVVLGVYHANVADVAGDVQIYDSVRRCTALCP
jgi:hypothetical protein